MEFTLWNLNAPGFWGSSGNSCHSGEAVTHVLCNSSAEEEQADGVSYSISETPSPCEDSPYQSTAETEYLPSKSDSEMDKDHNCLVNLELETDLEASALEPDLELKEETEFPVSRKQLKDESFEDEETTDTGQPADDCELGPTVDNLWNNSVVAANVNVKTESGTYNLDDYAHPIFGRLPAKRLEPLSDDSDDETPLEMALHEEDDEENEEVDEDEEEEPDEEDDEDDGGDDLNEDVKLSIVRNRAVPRLPISNNGYECGECNFMAETRPALKKHISMMHPSPTADSNLAHALMRKLSQSTCCPLASCRFRSADRTEMEAHVARHVAGGAQVSSKKKVAPVNLQRVRYEREEYKCQMCSYSCTIEKAFYKHLKLHSMGASASSASKISCVICGKDRPTEVDMNKHMRKHRDNRYFCCDICVFRTVQLKKLIQHRRMHTGEKPHLCPHCSYRSARRDNLRSHVRRVHKKDNLFCDTFSPKGLALNSASNSSPN